METTTTKTCELLPHACNAGIERPKAVVKPEILKAQPISRVKDIQTPWSIFGDVYWI
jgi:hypothetical protein